MTNWRGTKSKTTFSSIFSVHPDKMTDRWKIFSIIGYPYPSILIFRSLRSQGYYKTVIRWNVNWLQTVALFLGFSFIKITTFFGFHTNLGFSSPSPSWEIVYEYHWFLTRDPWIICSQPFHRPHFLSLDSPLVVNFLQVRISHKEYQEEGKSTSRLHTMNTKTGSGEIRLLEINSRLVSIFWTFLQTFFYNF